MNDNDLRAHISQNYRLHNLFKTMAGSQYNLNSFFANNPFYFSDNFVFQQKLLFENGLIVSNLLFSDTVYDTTCQCNLLDYSTDRPQLLLDQASHFETMLGMPFASSSSCNSLDAIDDQSMLTDDVQKHSDIDSLVSFLNRLNNIKLEFQTQEQAKQFKQFYFNFYLNNTNEAKIEQFLNSDFALNNQNLITHFIFQQDKAFDCCLDFIESDLFNAMHYCFDYYAINSAKKLIDREPGFFNTLVYDDLKQMSQNLNYNSNINFLFINAIEQHVLEKTNSKNNYYQLTKQSNQDNNQDNKNGKKPRIIL